MAAKPRYQVEISARAADELGRLRAFDQRPIVQSIRDLAHQAEVATRNRKRLVEPLERIPAATWELRVGRHRVFYEIRAPGTVRVLPVIIKDGTTVESL